MIIEEIKRRCALVGVGLLQIPMTYTITESSPNISVRMKMNAKMGSRNNLMASMIDQKLLDWFEDWFDENH